MAIRLPADIRFFSSIYPMVVFDALPGSFAALWMSKLGVEVMFITRISATIRFLRLVLVIIFINELRTKLVLSIAQLRKLCLCAFWTFGFGQLALSPF